MTLERQTGELKARTKRFAIASGRLFWASPKSSQAQVLGKQILGSRTAVGANDRAVCRARSKAKFLAKVGVVLEQADESLFWLELMDCRIVEAHRLAKIAREAQQLARIFAAIQQTTRTKSTP